MAYTIFDQTKPDPTQNITEYSTTIRTNLAAVRDIALLGTAPGWGYSYSGGTPDQPVDMLWSNGAERVKITCTWGTSGGSEDNLVQAQYQYSNDAGTTYETIGTESLAYDSNGTLTSTNWT